MFRKLGSLFLILLFVATSTAFGQLRIGYMNAQEVLSQMPQREGVQQKLNSFIQEKRAELKERTAAFQDSVAEFQQNQGNMSQSAIQQKEQQLSQMEASMQKFQQSLRQQVQQRRSALLQPLYEEMNNAIETVAENKNIDFVLNEATSTGENVIYYSSREQLDITQEVLDQITGTTAQN
jgi:outer membrane protein